jgi:hypothetical protein
MSHKEVNSDFLGDSYVSFIFRATAVRALGLERGTSILLQISLPMCQVRWVPCHHGMARPQVADGGDALQIGRVAANILNKQSRTADRV